MNLKTLFVIFLCLFTASIICNVAMVTLSAPEEWSGEAYRRVERTDYLINNAIELGSNLTMGDPIDGPGWP